MMEKDLPEGWEEVKIGEIGNVVTGSTPSKSEAEYYGDEIPFYKPTDLNQGYFTQIAKDNLSIIGGRKARILPEKSTLVTCIGATIGKTGFIRKAGTFNQQINGIFPHSPIVPEFVYYACINPDFQRDIVENSSSTTLPILNKSRFSELTIPLPPLAEQKRIVAKLDAAFGLLDRMKERLARIPEILKTFRQAVLTQAVTGKLTEEWREEKDFNIELEVEQIKRKRFVRYEEELKISREFNIKKPRNPTFDECEDFSPIRGWKRVYIEELFDIETGATPKRDVELYWNEGNVPWIKSGQVSNKDIIEADEYITEEALRDTNAKLYPVNSILIAMYGEGKTRGQVGILKFEATSNQAIAAMVNPSLPTETIQYVFYFGLSQYAEIRKVASGGNQPNLNTGKIKKWKIDYPPLAEQQEIVRRVEALLAKADAIEAQYLALKEKIERLPQALLAQAFRGELVPQDPDDEPAAVLLGKIKAGKGKQGVLF